MNDGKKQHRSISASGGNRFVGQSSAGPLASRRGTAVATTNNVEAMAAAARAKVQADQRVQEMGATLTKMHTLLKQMRAKNAATASKDSAAKANLEMWSLMLEQLDKQYEQAVAAAKQREDLEARRQALYKQADEKAVAAAAAATGGAADESCGAGEGPPSMPRLQLRPRRVRRPRPQRRARPRLRTEQRFDRQ